MIAAADPNPLTEAHYTFADGYMIAGPTRALVSRALQVKSTGTSITHSAPFLAMVPRDHYANFSAVIYQNLGTSLAPLAGLLGAFVPNANQPGRANPLNALSQHEADDAGGIRRAGPSYGRRQQQYARRGPGRLHGREPCGSGRKSGSIRSNDGNTGTAKSVSLE